MNPEYLPHESTTNVVDNIDSTELGTLDAKKQLCYDENLPTGAHMLRWIKGAVARQRNYDS